MKWDNRGGLSRRSRPMPPNNEPPKYRVVTAKQLGQGYVVGPFASLDCVRAFQVVKDNGDGTFVVIDPEFARAKE